MKYKIIIGANPWLSLAKSDWLAVNPDIDVKLVDVKLGDDYKFDLSALHEHSSEACDVFLAWGPELMNFQRLEIMGEIKRLGFKMPALISPMAFVCTTAKVEENAWVCAFSAVLSEARIGFNSRVGMYSSVGYKALLGRSVWVGERVSLGAEVKIGAQTFLGDSIKVFDQINIGRESYLDSKKPIGSDVMPGSFDLSRHGISGRIFDYSKR